MSSVVNSTLAFNSRGSSSGCDVKTSAQRPATIGADMEVP